MKYDIHLRYYPIHNGTSVKASGIAIVPDPDSPDHPWNLYHEVDYDVWAMMPGKPVPWVHWPDADEQTRREFFDFCRKDIEVGITYDAGDLCGLTADAFNFPITGEFIATEEDAPDPEGLDID